MAQVQTAGDPPGRWVLDTSRGAPLSRAASEALEACGAAGWSDPTAITLEGRRAGQLLSAAKESVAAAMGLPGQTLRITSGAARALTEGLKGLLLEQSRRQENALLIVTAIDHSAVLRVARWWASNGGEVATVGVDAQGHIDSEHLIALAGAHPGSVVGLQWANPEVGTIQPIEPIVESLTAAQTNVLVDATGALGRIPLPAISSAAAVVADSLSWGGPRGVSFLGLRGAGSWLEPRPEVLDEVPVALTVAAASSLESAIADMPTLDAIARTQTARVRHDCGQTIPDLDIPGDSDNRLPHVLTMSALYLDGESLVRRLDAEGLALGSGSACTNDSGEPSHVLAAMGALTGGNLRLSLPLGLPNEPIDRLITRLPGIISELRSTT